MMARLLPGINQFRMFPRPHSAAYRTPDNHKQSHPHVEYTKVLSPSQAPHLQGLRQPGTPCPAAFFRLRFRHPQTFRQFLSELLRIRSLPCILLKIICSPSPAKPAFIKSCSPSSHEKALTGACSRRRYSLENSAPPKADIPLLLIQFPANLRKIFIFQRLFRNLHGQNRLSGRRKKIFYISKIS